MIPVALIAVLLVALGVVMTFTLDDLMRKDVIQRLADEAAERERLRALLARQRDEVLASQKTLARAGYYKGPLSGPGAGVTGAHHRAAMNAWAKDVWAGIRAPHGSPERKKLNSISGVWE